MIKYSQNIQNIIMFPVALNNSTVTLSLVIPFIYPSHCRNNQAGISGLASFASISFPCLHF